MPRYYTIPDWHERGRVTITPKSFWRRLKIFPYIVGNIVRFHVHVDKPFPKTYLQNCSIYELISGKGKWIANIDGTDAEVTGSRIPVEGDVVYFIGIAPYTDQLEPIFTTTVHSWDTITDKWFLLLGGALIGWLLSSGINFIKGLIK